MTYVEFLTVFKSNTPSRRSAAWLGLIALLIVLAVMSYVILVSYFLRSEISTSVQRAEFYAQSMDDALTRLEHLPYVLSIDPTTLAAVQTRNVKRLNPVLTEVAERAKAELVYVLDAQGTTLAASNHDQSDSLIGNQYRFRPYFQDALTGQQGRFYAVGVTTGRPGYFMAEPIRDAGDNIVGVVVVKVGIADLSRALSNSGELVFVSNQQGVVLAGAQDDLIYGYMSDLSVREEQIFADQRQFGDQALFALDWHVQTANRSRLNGTQYVWAQATLDVENWTLHFLSEVNEIRRLALLYTGSALLTLFALFVAASLYRAAQLRKALLISNADRTRLAREIEERRRAQQKLETAQVALARRDQLATLGQLSASITHELGQPISAMKNYLAAEEIATGGLPGTLWPELSGLVERMQRILNQLRVFGRKAEADPSIFNAQDAVQAAVRLVAHTAEAADVTLSCSQPDEPCRLRGQPDRFEQVLVNLLRNAIDAAQEGSFAQSDAAQVYLRLVCEDDHIAVHVFDNGNGLGDLDIGALREPFFSTKASGKGMGLGLAISGQIIDEMGGSFFAENVNLHYKPMPPVFGEAGITQGAVFYVTLPKQIAST